MTWAKGQSGNPNGRPRRGQTLTEVLRRKLLEKGPDGRPNVEAINDEVLALALSGERWAIELCFDRLEGRPAQALELSGNERRPLRIEYVLPSGKVEGNGEKA